MKEYDLTPQKLDWYYKAGQKSSKIINKSHDQFFKRKAT